MKSQPLSSTRGEASERVAEGLYVNILALLTILVDHSRRMKLQVEKSLGEELGRLFLWGESFRKGKLDAILESYPDLRLSVLKSLITLSRIILRGKTSEN